MEQKNIEATEEIIFTLFQTHGDSIRFIEYHTMMNDKLEEVSAEEEQKAIDNLISKNYLIHNSTGTVRDSFTRGISFSEWEDQHNNTSKSNTTVNTINISHNNHGNIISNSNVGNNNKINSEKKDKTGFLSSPKWAGIGVIATTIIAGMVYIQPDLFKDIAIKKDSTTISNKEKIYIYKTPQELFDWHKGVANELQADELSKTLYAGKYIKLEGVIVGIRPSLLNDGKGAILNLDLEKGYSAIVYFDKKDIVSTLSKGKKVVLNSRFVLLRSSVISTDKGEILKVIK